MFVFCAYCGKCACITLNRSPLDPVNCEKKDACPDWELWFVVQSLSHVLLFATPWTAAGQASLSSPQRAGGGMGHGSESVHACAQLCLTLRPHGLQPARLLCPWDSPSKNTGVGCHAFLQGIFSTQGLNPHLLRLLLCRCILYHWSPKSHEGCSLGHFTTLGILSNLWLLFVIPITHLKVYLH